MNRPAWLVAALLAMMAALMTSHLQLLRNNMVDCDLYLKFLYGRLERTAVGSPEAAILRKELQETYSGKTTECANLEADFSDASDQYLNVILALLGGAGVAGGVAVRHRVSGAPAPTTAPPAPPPEPPQSTPSPPSPAPEPGLPSSPAEPPKPPRAESPLDRIKRQESL